MSNTLSELKEKAFELTEAERAELAQSLIESLDGPAEEGVEEAWRLEMIHPQKQCLKKHSPCQNRSVFSAKMEEIGRPDPWPV